MSHNLPRNKLTNKHMAGKGDRARHAVNDTWRKNYERVFGKKPPVVDKAAVSGVIKLSDAGHITGRIDPTKK